VKVVFVPRELDFDCWVGGCSVVVWCGDFASW